MVVENFLEETFSFNHGDRYHVLMKKLSDEVESDETEVEFEEFTEEQQLAYDEYYKDFEEMITQNCEETMIKNRYPMQ